MSLRVSGGFLRGRALSSPPGGSHRPLTGRLKESLFHLVGERLESAAVLDLFAGVGVFGIEALSRGAARATFVERSDELVAALEGNLRACGLTDLARVSGDDVLAYLEITRPALPYDVVFLDPPYGRGLAFLTIERLAAWPGFGPGTLGIAKTFKKEHFAGPSPLILAEERRLGDDNLIFFERSADVTESPSGPPAGGG